MEPVNLQQYQQQFRPADNYRPTNPSPKTTNNQEYAQYLAQATPGQFKPVKLYVLFNDATSQQCIRGVQQSSSLDRRVEIIDVGQPQYRPHWLKGVPSIMNEEKKFYLGPEAVMWVRYQAKQALAAVNESNGISQIMTSAPAAVDGIASRAGVLLQTSAVEQKMVSDQDVFQSVRNGANRGYDSVAARPEPKIQNPGQQALPEQFRPQATQRGGNMEQYNSQIEKIAQERNNLMRQPHRPHHQQQQFGWNSNLPQQQQPQPSHQGNHVTDQRLAQMQQDRNSLQVTRRTF